MLYCSLLPFNDEHLVGALEKFVRHAAHRGVETCAAERCKRRSKVRRDLSVQIEQGENADFSCDTAKLAQGRKMKGFAQVLRVEEEKMGTEGKVEGAIREGELGKSGNDIATTMSIAHKVAQECVHGSPAHLTQCRN